MFVFFGTIVITAVASACTRLQMRRRPHEFVWVADTPHYRRAGAQFAVYATAVLMIAVNAPRIAASIVAAEVLVLSAPRLAARAASGGIRGRALAQEIAWNLLGLATAIAVLRGGDLVWQIGLTYVVASIVAWEATVLLAGVAPRTTSIPGGIGVDAPA